MFALSEKYHLAPEWWLEHSPVWLAEARKHIMVVNRVMELRTKEQIMVRDLNAYTRHLSAGGDVKLVTGADI